MSRCVDETNGGFRVHLRSARMASLMSDSPATVTGS